MQRHTSATVVLNVGVALVGVMVARLLATGTHIVLARQMGVADYGMYTTLYTLLGYTVVFTGLGLDTWLLHQGGRPATLDDSISQVFSLRLFATGGLMAAAVAVLVASGQSSAAQPLVLAALGLTCELLLTTGNSALRAQVRNRGAALLQVVVAALFLGLVGLMWNQQAPLLSATLYRLVADVAGVVVLVALLRRNLHLTMWTWSRFARLIRQARAFFAADLLATVALKADLTLVALLIGAVGTGIYSPALTIINTTFIIPSVAWQVLLPVLSAQQVGSRMYRRIVAGALAGSLLYGVIWALILGPNAALVIDLVLEAEYRATVPLLQIMSFIPLLKSLNFCWAMMMVANGDQALRTKFLAGGAAINVLANLVSIPLLGLVGAAWVNLATEIVLLAGYSYGAFLSLRRPRYPVA